MQNHFRRNGKLRKNDNYKKYNYCKNVTVYSVTLCAGMRDIYVSQVTMKVQSRYMSYCQTRVKSVTTRLSKYSSESVYCPICTPIFSLCQSHTNSHNYHSRTVAKSWPLQWHQVQNLPTTDQRQDTSYG